MKNDQDQKTDRKVARKSRKGAGKNGEPFKKLRVIVLCHEDPARPDYLSRQGSVKDGARVPSHPGAGIRGLSDESRRQTIQAAEVSLAREIDQRRRIGWYRARFDRQRRCKTRGARGLHSSADKN